MEKNYMKRQEYIAAMLSYFGRLVQSSHYWWSEFTIFLFSFRAVLEYDVESYMYINFLFDYKGFSLIVICEYHDIYLCIQLLMYCNIVELSDSFPQKQPAIKLRSIYHRLQGQPCQSIIDSYPYSPRWNTVVMVEKLR